MKKLLSLTLVAAIALGSMNIQAVQENEAVLAGKALIYRKKSSKRAYILPILLIGAGVWESVLGAVAIYGSFVAPKVASAAMSNIVVNACTRSDTPEAQQNNLLGTGPVLQKISFLGDVSKNGFRSLGIMVFLHGIIDVVEGVQYLKKVKSGLLIKFENEVEKTRKEQVQA